MLPLPHHLEPESATTFNLGALFNAGGLRASLVARGIVFNNNTACTQGAPANTVNAGS